MLLIRVLVLSCLVLLLCRTSRASPVPKRPIRPEKALPIENFISKSNGIDPSEEIRGRIYTEQALRLRHKSPWTDANANLKELAFRKHASEPKKGHPEKGPNKGHPDKGLNKSAPKQSGDASSQENPKPASQETNEAADDSKSNAKDDSVTDTSTDPHGRDGENVTSADSSGGGRPKHQSSGSADGSSEVKGAESSNAGEEGSSATKPDPSADGESPGHESDDAAGSNNPDKNQSANEPHDPSDESKTDDSPDKEKAESQTGSTENDKTAPKSSSDGDSQATGPNASVPESDGNSGSAPRKADEDHPMAPLRGSTIAGKASIIGLASFGVVVLIAGLVFLSRSEISLCGINWNGNSHSYEQVSQRDEPAEVSDLNKGTQLDADGWNEGWEQEDWDNAETEKP